MSKKGFSCDLHVHSKYSLGSDSWIMRSLNVPRSYTPPELLYEMSKKRGMDLVTITDINTIEGALSISHLPGTFISEEISTYLHGERKAIHILVYGITFEDHNEITRVRDSFPDLMDCLNDRNIINSFAHPFYFPGTDLKPRELAKVIRGVGLVETRNGSRSRFENDAVIQITKVLRDDMEFRGFTGGSDDHCGRFSGTTYTIVREAHTIEEYLAGLRAGRTEVCGDHGNATRSAYSVYSVAYTYYRNKLTSAKTTDLKMSAIDSFLDPTAAGEEPTFWHKADFLFNHFLRKVTKTGGKLEDIVADQLIEIGKDLNLRKGSPELESEGIDERTFEILNALTNRLLKYYSSLISEKVADGDILATIESLTRLIPVLLLNLPYPVAYMNRRKGHETVEEIQHNYLSDKSSEVSLDKRAWFTDTIDDLNGVSRTIQKYSKLAVESGRELHIVACQSRKLEFPGRVKNFKPLNEFPVPDYHSKLLSVPPFLEIAKFIEENEIEMIYISTPGPVGLAGLGISRLLGIPCAGIYHTDYLRHVNHIIQDGKLGQLVGNCGAWFYKSMDMVLVPSRYYMDDIESMGLSRDKMKLFPRGTDCTAFSPSKRSSQFLKKYNLDPEKITISYVGRVSREKDLDILSEAYLQLKKKYSSIQILIVGEGPYLVELRKDLKNSDAYFTGELSGQSLYEAYASSDIFVFPSSTDTYGNSVLEAQASGLPAIVTDSGGPQEIIIPGETGLVCLSHNPEDLKEKMLELCRNSELRNSMGRAAREMALERTWEKAFDLLWNIGITGEVERETAKKADPKTD